MSQTWVSSFHKASSQPIPYPVITTSSLPAGTVGTAYSTTLNASGFGPFSWALTAGSIDPGLALNSSTGGIAGTPIGATTYSGTFRVTDAFGRTSLQTLSLTISGTGVPKRMGGLLSAGGGGAFAPELYPNFKNRFREGYIVAGATPDGNGWPSAAYSWNAYSGSGTPGWTSGTFKSGYIGTGSPSAFGPCVIDNIVLGNGTSTYTTFDLHSVTGPNFGYSNSAAANSCFNYLPGYPGTAVDDPTNPNAVTTECVALWVLLGHLRTEWTDTSMWNSQLSTAANRHTPSNTQVFYQTNQWFGNQHDATLSSLPAAGATNAALTGWARGAGTWCFVFNESSNFESRICTVGTGANPTISWASTRGLTANVTSTSLSYGVQAYPFEWVLAIAVASNVGLTSCEATLQDGANNVAGSYTAARMALVASYRAQYPSWTAPVQFTPGNENWNPTYNSYRVFLECAALFGYPSKEAYAGAWMHALGNLGRAQFGAQWGGSSVGAVLEWQDKNPGEFWSTLSYMQGTLGVTPSNDIQAIATAPYMLPSGLTSSSSISQVQAAVAAVASTQAATSLVCDIVIMGMHYGLWHQTYEGGVAWDNPAFSGFANLAAAIMDAGYAAPLETYYKLLQDYGSQAFYHTVIGGSNLAGGGNSGDSLGNVWPPTIANTPALAALSNINTTNPTFARNLINGSGAIILGGNYGSKTGAANPSFPGGTFATGWGSPYFSAQGYVGWFFNCTLAGTYSLAITCAGSGTPLTNVEIGGLAGFTIPFTAKTLSAGVNNVGSVTIPLGPGYLLLGNGTPQSTLTISQWQVN